MLTKHILTKELKPRTHNAKIIGIMIAIICVCLAFAAGFFVRGDQALLEAFGFKSLLNFSEETHSPLSTDTTISLAARMAEVEDILKRDSLDDYDIDEMTSEMLEAFTNANDDEYLRYFDEDRYQNYVKEQTQAYAGIGVLFSEHNGQAYAVDVFPGSRAESAGVKVGDFVAGIDGDSSHQWSLTEVINATSRNEGESVVVSWRRPASLDASGGEERITTLECFDYSEANVTTEIRDEVGYIKLTQITQNSANLTRDALNELSAQGALAFVLDIRDNPGGYLTQSVDIASLFIKSGVIVSIETNESQNSTKTATGTVINDSPLVLIINENTAGAAEVIAAALKDNERATIVGHTSLGKGSVQIVKALSFGGALRYSAAYYKSPLGHDINEVGVLPHIFVERGSDLETDDQKNLALETAQSSISG